MRISLFGVVFVGCALYSQPSRPEAFGFVGGLRAAGDEGFLGSGVLWGGGVMMPIRSRLGIDLDAGTATTRRNLGGEAFRMRRTFAGSAWWAVGERSEPIFSPVAELALSTAAVNSMERTILLTRRAAWWAGPALFMRYMEIRCFDWICFGRRSVRFPASVSAARSAIDSSAVVALHSAMAAQH